MDKNKLDKTPDILKKIKQKGSKNKEYNNFPLDKEGDSYLFEQNDIWIVSDSSTSFTHFDQKNYA